MRSWLLGVVAVLVIARSVAAAPEDAAPSPDAPAPSPGDLERAADAPPLIEPPEPITDETAAQGPLVFIESIDVRGNTATQSELILRALTVAPGDVLHSGDKRLRELRFKVLALGFFLDVTVAMRKGSARGQVIVEIAVVERGTVVLNRLWFGSNALSPYWIGADVGERNLLGLGVAVGAGVIYADNGGIDGARPQWAGEVRAADSSLFGTRLGINGSVTLVRGSESYRIAGIDNDTEDRDFAAFRYRRFGGRGALTYDLNALTRISAGMRGEVIDAALPSAPTRELPGGQVTAIDLHLEPNHSRVATLGFTIDRDTRPDPTLPHSGGRVLASFELGSSLYGSSYDFASVFGRFEHWWPLRQDRHTIGVRLAGGVIVGKAPRFDRIHVSDVDRMLTPRALGLVLSNSAPLDLLGTRGDKASYGDVGGSVTLEYAARIFRGSGKRRLYGGDLFLGVGLWGLADSADLRARDASLFRSLPIDLYADAGIRVDTDIGIFEFTLANGLGRLR